MAASSNPRTKQQKLLSLVDGDNLAVYSVPADW